MRLRIGLICLWLSVGKLGFSPFSLSRLKIYTSMFYQINSPDFIRIGQSGLVNAFQVPTTSLVSVPS